MRTTAAGLVLILVTVAGCAARPAAPVPEVADNATSTDTAWLQLMIPMTERLLEALDLVSGRGTAAALGPALAPIGSTHRAELDQLRHERDRAGVPAGNVHSGHTMPGMITEADLAELRSLTGAAFDQRLLTLIRAHLDQSALLCEGETRSGTDPALRALAGSIEHSRAAERAGLGP
jgi:uncharacterized protein (DUF305 family)